MPRRLLALAFVVAVAIAAATPAVAQPVRGTVRGQVTMADGTGVPGVEVSLQNENGATVSRVSTDEHGRFDIPDVALGRYTLRGALAGLEGEAGADLRFEASATVRIVLRTPVFDGGDYAVEGRLLLDEFKWTTPGDALRATPVALQSRALPTVLAAAPGWAEEDNGLLHVRGADDGVLYVEDGIPIYDRQDASFGVPSSLAGVGTAEITLGRTPPQYGLKSGAVVELYSPPAPTEWSSQLHAGTGSNETSGVSATAGGPLPGRMDLFMAAALERSSRFLDPVHPSGFHNDGDVGGAIFRARLKTGSYSNVLLKGQTGRSRFDVPHGEQSELAGQDQRQHVSQRSLSLSSGQPLGNSWAVDIAANGRRVEGRLTDSPFDTPLSASSTRRQSRLAMRGTLFGSLAAHHLETGGELMRVALAEDFTFAVTNDAAGTLSNVVRRFTPLEPFLFSGRATRVQSAAFIRDQLWSGPWMVDLGLRYDHTKLLVPASQWSPRLAAAWQSWPLHGALRLSFNRFFQPPQAEHLLLASSEAARALSPFASDDDRESGGAAIEPERQTAWELGWEQRLPASLTLDVAAWHRRVENYSDPNVFFGTTIVFPNSVAKGTARGVDVRLTLPSRNGWSASASYSLSKVEQEGPINGGLFLEDDIDALGPGVRFTPDHDQRHVAAATVTWVPAVSRWSASAQARYASGTPLEVGDLDDDDLADLLERPGADLIDVERGRVKPRLVVDVTASARLLRAGRAQLSLGASVLNAFNRRYAFNFGNPFSGTHFGAPRQFRIDLSASFR